MQDAQRKMSKRYILNILLCDKSSFFSPLQLDRRSHLWGCFSSPAGPGAVVHRFEVLNTFAWDITSSYSSSSGIVIIHLLSAVRSFFSSADTYVPSSFLASSYTTLIHSGSLGP